MTVRKTRVYYIKKIITLLEEYKLEIVKEIPTLETPKLKEYYRTTLTSILVNQGILEERIKEILIQIIEGEIVDKITETLHILTIQSGPTYRSNTTDKHHHIVYEPPYVINTYLRSNNNIFHNFIGTHYIVN